MRHLFLLAALLLPSLLPAAHSPDLTEGIRLIRSRNPRHLDRGVSLVHMAAMHDEAMAEYVMGWLNLKGKGMQRAPKRAVRWFRKAAERGHLKSQIALGRLLGHSRRSSYQNEAREWLEEARAQGSATAKMLLTELAKGRLGDDMMDKTEAAMAPAGSGSSRAEGGAMATKAARMSKASKAAMAAQVDAAVINLGRGTAATPEQEAMWQKQREAEAAAEAQRRQGWAKEAAARAAAEAKANQAARRSGSGSSRSAGSGSSW